MSAILEFTWDSRELAVWRGRRVDQALLRAMTKAGGEAARAMRAESSRHIRKRKRFRVSLVNRSLPLEFPKGRELGDLEWRMRVSGEAMPLTALPHRQQRAGVSVEVNKGQRKLVKSAFVATMASGHKGIFHRMGKGRLPIDEAFTSRISDVMQDQEAIPAAYARAQVVFSSAFTRLFDLELGKL